MLLSMENDVAFAVVHESVDVPPWSTDEGDAESVQVGAEGGGGLTVMSVEQCTVPPAPVAVSVYVTVL